MWLNIKTKRKIICIVFLSIDFSWIAIGLAATRTIRPSTTPSRISSQKKLVSLQNQLIVSSSNSSVVKAAKHGS